MTEPAPIRKPRRWLRYLLITFGLLFLLSLAHTAGYVRALVDTGSSSVDHPEDQEPEFDETWSYGHGTTKVVRIELSGVIMRGGEGLFEAAEDSVVSVLKQIAAARHDKEVRAILLEIDSPGGAVTPSDEIYQALIDFKGSQPGRKVIAAVRDLAASGGYYVAAAADYIIAQPTSIIGSIGVIMQSVNVKGLTEKLGITGVTIKSGANKDLLNPLEPVNPEHTAVVKKVIDSAYDRFVHIVAGSRGIEDGELRRIADGSIYDASEALKLRLIDEIGYFDAAVAKTASLLGEKDLRIIRYEADKGFLSALLSARAPDPVRAMESIRSQLRPRIQYLWQP